MIGDLIRSHRKRLGLTQEDLAARAGVHTRTIGKIEAGQISSSRQSTARLLAEALGLVGAEREAFFQAAASTVDTSTQPAPSRLRGDPQLDPPAEVAQPVTPSVNALPLSAAAFTGRERELRALDALIPEGTAPLITVTGAGGIGKTALVLHWAQGISARYPDGLLYVDLEGFSNRRPLSPTEALSRLLHQLGVAPARIPAQEAHAVDLFRTSIAGRRILIVIDNARDSHQVRPLLAAGSGCGTLVTSRTRLSGLVAREGAVPLDLDVMSPTEANVLLTALLGADDRDQLDELARMCAYVPLALRIAAASILARPAGVTGYLDRMRTSDRLAALQLDGDDHTAIATTFAYSYALLDHDTRRLFRLLGLVPGPDVTSETAGDLAGLPAATARTLLLELVAVHLVEERAPGRFGSHDLLRLFAAQQAPAAEGPAARDAALERLYTHYASRVDAAARRLYPQVLRLPPSGPLPSYTFESDAAAVGWLDAERLNLVAAATYGCEQGPRWLAWTIANDLRGYFFIRMFLVQWDAVAHAALRAAEAAGDKRARAAAHLNLADLHWRQGAIEPAETAFAAAAADASAGGWPAGQATAVGNLGGLRRMQGRLTDAVALLEESLRLNTEIGRAEGQLVNLGNLGVAYGELGEWQRSEDYLVRTYAICEQVGSRSGQAVSLSNLVETAIHLGDADLAQARQEQALALHRELGDKAGTASTIRSGAVLELLRGDLPAALTTARAATELAGESDDHRVLAHCLHVTATVLQAAGDSDAALEAAEEAVRLAHEAGHRFVETRALVGLARILRARREPEKAQSSAGQALALAESCGYRQLAAEAAREIRRC